MTDSEKLGIINLLVGNYISEELNAKECVESIIDVLNNVDIDLSQYTKQ